MYQENMLMAFPSTPGLPQAGASSQPSNLPPYTPTPSSLSTKFELSSTPPTAKNPIIPIYRSQNFPSQLSDGSPPEYHHSARAIDSKPAYIFHFDPSTENTVLTTPDGQKIASISFLKPRRQTITTFETLHDAELQTLAGSSFTIVDEEAGEDGDHVLLHSETLSNDDEDDNGVQEEEEEVGSVLLLDTFVPAKETITLSSHKYFHPKGTKFTAHSGNSYRWQKSISAATPTPPVSPPRKGMPTSARPHSTFVLICSPPKNRRSVAPEQKKMIGRISVNGSKATLELQGGQEELSEAMFLGSAIAMLKKLDLKAKRQRAQRMLPQNVMQITF